MMSRVMQHGNVRVLLVVRINYNPDLMILPFVHTYKITGQNQPDQNDGINF